MSLLFRRVDGVTFRGLNQNAVSGNCYAVAGVFFMGKVCRNSYIGTVRCLLYQSVFRETGKICLGN